MKVEEGVLESSVDTNSYNGKPGSPRVAAEPPNSSQSDEHARSGEGRKYRRPGEYVTEDFIKLNEKVIVPVKEFPKVILSLLTNFTLYLHYFFLNNFAFHFEYQPAIQFSRI